VAEGIRFVRQRQAMLGAMSLNMFAVIFGGASALLRVYATRILDVGAGGMASWQPLSSSGPSLALSRWSCGRRSSERAAPS